MGVKGKVVLIAGGTGALGRTVVPLFSKAGAAVVTVDRHVPHSLTPGQRAVAADVTDETDVGRVVTEVLKDVGRLDALINLVGAFTPGSAAETEFAVWQKMLSINVTAAYVLSRAVIPHMTGARAGRIVHIAARAAQQPFSGAAAYIVAKSALVSLIRVLAIELAGSGVTVNGILPTTIDTPANRKGMPNADTSKWVRPESIAQLLLFLVSEEASQVNGALVPIGSP